MGRHSRLAKSVQIVVEHPQVTDGHERLRRAFDLILRDGARADEKNEAQDAERKGDEP